MPNRQRDWKYIRIGLATLVVVGACSRPGLIRQVATPAASGPTDIPAGRLLAGTLVQAQLRQPVSSATSHRGDRVEFELLDGISDARGVDRVPRGALVSGTVRATDRSGRPGDSAVIELELTGWQAQGEPLRALPLEVASAPAQVSPAWGRRLAWGLGGAAAGAVTAVVIDDDSGPLLAAGTVIGAAAAALLSQFWETRDVTLPAGSVVTLRVAREVSVDGWAGGGAVSSGRAAPTSTVSDPASPSTDGRHP